MGNGYSLALDNDKMYELAHKTASYKERGVSHKNSLLEIQETLTEFIILLEEFYRQQRKDKQLSGFYRSIISIRRSVRRNPWNQLLPTD